MTEIWNAIGILSLVTIVGIIVRLRIRELKDLEKQILEDINHDR
jgi:hypothetical protein